MANILCIDIGGTRIKAGILNNNITIEELKNTNIKVMETLGWMNSSLPEIICKDHFASLTYENDDFRHYDFISIGVPLKVLDNGKLIEGHYIDKYGVPKNLLEAFKNMANCEIIIINDGVAWMNGVLKYFKLCSVEIEFPCLAIILGTGVGIAYADSYGSIKGFELSEQNKFYKFLSEILNENIHEGKIIHEVLGSKFFNHIKDTHKNWTYVEIQNEYTKRLINLLKDIEDVETYNYKNIKSVIIGGGNSKYLCISNLNSSINKSIYMLSKNNLQLNPDLIPLLGLASSANKHYQNK